MKDALESALGRIDFWLQLFAVVVAVGVTGEAVFGLKHWILNRRLQVIQHSEDQERQDEIARLNKEAGEARKAAGEAIKSAEVARKDAEAFRLDIANANERSAQANEKAEEERLARLKIEERLAPRRISPKEHRRLVAALSPYRGSSVELTKLGDLEAGRFADDIILALTESGWKVALSFVGVMGPPVYNLHCIVNESASGRALGTALKEIPKADVEDSPNLPVSGRIMIGLKPPQ